jgi:hypothetical protein
MPDLNVRTLAAYTLFNAALELLALDRTVIELTARDYASVDEMGAALTLLSRKILLLERRSNVSTNLFDNTVGLC